MPIINGCKYSCEPCIRGHRATSCKHTDRMLIEVRKPGRPLETCGHEFATCTCKKLDEWLATGQVISSVDSGEKGKDTTTTFIAICPPPASHAKKARLARTREQRPKVKRRKTNRKSPSSSPPSTSSSTKNSTSGEKSTETRKPSVGEGKFQVNSNQISEDPKFSAAPQANSTLSWTNTPQYPPYYPSLPIAYLLNDTHDFPDARYQQEPEHFVVCEETQTDYQAQCHHQKGPENYLSRVEDVVLRPSQSMSVGSVERLTNIQPQYIGIGRELAWK